MRSASAIIPPCHRAKSGDNGNRRIRHCRKFESSSRLLFRDECRHKRTTTPRPTSQNTERTNGSPSPSRRHTHTDTSITRRNAFKSERKKKSARFENGRREPLKTHSTKDGLLLLSRSSTRISGQPRPQLSSSARLLRPRRSVAVVRDPFAGTSVTGRRRRRAHHGSPKSHDGCSREPFHSLRDAGRRRGIETCVQVAGASATKPRNQRRSLNL